MEASKYIDHTLLKADATKEQIHQLCMEAMTYHFASVCVNSYWVAYCASLVKDSDVCVCSVVGFPLGAMSTKAKAFETNLAILDGADEIDMVMNIGELKAGHDAAVLEDIKAVVKASNGHVVKVILETCLLTRDEIQRACKLCVEAKATFVKTSTGFSTRGATLDDVILMRESVDGACLIKAAGGVRNHAQMQEMIKAGASRIGTSSGISLLKE